MDMLQRIERKFDSTRSICQLNGLTSQKCAGSDRPRVPNAI